MVDKKIDAPAKISNRRPVASSKDDGSKPMVDKKISAPAKISNRHPSAGPKEDGLTPWAVKGELILNCNCTIFCPCVVSLGKHAPTEGYCQAWAGVRI